MNLLAVVGFRQLGKTAGTIAASHFFSRMAVVLVGLIVLYALISAAASVLGRALTGTTAGGLIETLGYVNFYLLTTVLALPGILLFWFMMQSGMIDRALGTAGRSGK